MTARQNETYRTPTPEILAMSNEELCDYLEWVVYKQRHAKLSTGLRLTLPEFIRRFRSVMGMPARSPDDVPDLEYDYLASPHTYYQAQLRQRRAARQQPAPPPPVTPPKQSNVVLSSMLPPKEDGAMELLLAVLRAMPDDAKQRVAAELGQKAIAPARVPADAVPVRRRRSTRPPKGR